MCMRLPYATAYLSIKSIFSKPNDDVRISRIGIRDNIESCPKAMCEGQKVRVLKKCTHGPFGSSKTKPAMDPFWYCTWRTPTVSLRKRRRSATRAWIRGYVIFNSKAIYLLRDRRRPLRNLATLRSYYHQSKR